MTCPRFFFRTTLVGTLILISCLSVFTQQKSSAIEGRVVDGAGAVIPTAWVVLARTSDDRELKRVLTDAEGRYEFSEVSPGKYELTVKSASMANRTVRKGVEVTSLKKAQVDLVFYYEPCLGDDVVGNDSTVTDDIRADIVRALIDMSQGTADAPIIFVPRNINVDWLTGSQKSRLSIMTREEVQPLTEKTGKHSYFWVSPMTRRGNCIGVSMNEGVAIKGQVEDANMAGTGTIYEFWRIDGRWVGKVLTSWIA